MFSPSLLLYKLPRAAQNKSAMDCVDKNGISLPLSLSGSCVSDINIVRDLVHAFLVSLTFNYITLVFDFALYSVLPVCLFSYNLCFPNKDASLVGLMAILYYSNYDTAICTLAYFPGMSY